MRPKQFEEIDRLPLAVSNEEYEDFELERTKAGFKNPSEFFRYMFQEVKDLISQNVEVFDQKKTRMLNLSLSAQMKKMFDGFVVALDVNRAVLFRGVLKIWKRRKEKNPYKLSDVQKMKRERILLMEKLLLEERKACKEHVIVPHIDENGNITENAKCAICEDFFGRFCEHSPDHVCHSHVNENEKVSLANDAEIDPPKNYKELQWKDVCFYCGRGDNIGHTEEEEMKQKQVM